MSKQVSYCHFPPNNIRKKKRKIKTQSRKIFQRTTTHILKKRKRLLSNKIKQNKNEKLSKSYPFIFYLTCYLAIPAQYRLLIYLQWPAFISVPLLLTKKRGLDIWIGVCMMNIQQTKVHRLVKSHGWALSWFLPCNAQRQLAGTTARQREGGQGRWDTRQNEKWKWFYCVRQELRSCGTAGVNGRTRYLPSGN